MRDSTIRALGLEPHQSASFTITFGRRPKMIGLIRRFVGEFYEQFYDELVAPIEQRSEWPSQVALAAHELVENAVRHGFESDAVFTVGVDADPADPERAHLLYLTTRNRATAAQRERVRQRLQDLRETEDLFTFYLGLLTASTSGRGGPGLGLARIRVEAQMDLLSTVDGETLEVTAQAHVRSGARR